ncbi:MMPL family transporter [Glaciihabitans sp. UYNi722]|uniref:MMPL family transporter n=1 Tax=Glaciihabitans sp. UYNi722 TaxID=3156344 RepID=UPI003397ECEF
MSDFLYRLGRGVYTHKWWSIGAWIIVIGVMVALLIGSPPKTTDNIRIDGSPSQKVLDTLSTEFPAAAGSSGTLVFAAPPGSTVTDPDIASSIARSVDAVNGNKYIVTPVVPTTVTEPTPQQMRAAAASASVLHPLVIGQTVFPSVLVSKDKTVALFTIQLTKQVDDIPPSEVSHVIDVATKPVAAQKVTVYPSDTLLGHGVTLSGETEIAGLLIAAIILFLTLGSLLVAGLPLLTALIGVAVGVGGAFTLSHLVTLTSVTPTLALMVGLAVGIDYSLFIVNRQRRIILSEGISAKDAAGRAIGTAGTAVVFAGLTVVIALAGLSVVGISFLTVMALVAAATVGVAVLVAITLLPAILGLIGERVVTPRARRKSAADPREETTTLGYRVGAGLVRRRVPVIIAVVAILGVVAIPAMSLQLGLPSSSTKNLDTPDRKGYDLVSEKFGAGFNGQLVVVATSATRGTPIDANDSADLATRIGTVSGVRLSLSSATSENGETALITVIPRTGPDSQQTADLVTKLRSLHGEFARHYGVSTGVTGFTAANIDLTAGLAKALPIYLGVIVLLSLIIMLLIFRSIVIPLQATLGFVLSILATLGASTAVFQWGWLKQLFGFDTPGPVLNFLPIIAMGILYGLAMDYQVFLVSSMREAHKHGHSGKEAIIVGFARSSRVVVAAAFIMVSVFLGFALSDNQEVKQIGFALSIGILFDAFLVRLILTPALLSLLGRWTWSLPRWLNRILPNVDIEGDALLKRLEQERLLVDVADASRSPTG